MVADISCLYAPHHTHHQAAVRDECWRTLRLFGGASGRQPNIPLTSQKVTGHHYSSREFPAYLETFSRPVRDDALLFKQERMTMKTQGTTPGTVDDRLAYGIEEFARLAGIGRTTAFEQIRIGKLRAIKRGRRTLITADAARAWLSDK
jgi:hypothetical protein